MALTYNHQFEIELLKLVKAEMEEWTKNLALGTSASTYDEYRNQVGYLRGLQKTIELCDEAQSIINKR